MRRLGISGVMPPLPTCHRGVRGDYFVFNVDHLIEGGMSKKCSIRSVGVKHL